VFYMGTEDTCYCLWCCVIFLFCLFYSWVAMMIHLPIREIMLSSIILFGTCGIIMLSSIILFGTCGILYFLLLN
jgi:hypothetical protein